MQRQFYATSDDLLSVLALVEKKRCLAYTEMGLFESNNRNTVFAGKDIPTLNLTALGSNAINGYSYLVTLVDAQINIREIPQRKGVSLFAIDQLENPDSITFMHGGIYDSNVLLNGVVGTCTGTTASKKLYNSFAYAIAKNFSRIQAYYVGPEAKNLMSRGTRLTFGADSPPEYDLAYE